MVAGIPHSARSPKFALTKNESCDGLGGFAAPDRGMEIAPILRGRARRGAAMRRLGKREIEGHRERQLARERALLGMILEHESDRPTLLDGDPVSGDRGFTPQPPARVARFLSRPTSM